MKILVSVDGSPYSKHMLAYLAAHDEWLGGSHSYTVLHVVPGLPSRATAAMDKKILQAFYETESEKVLKPIRTFFAKHAELPVSFVVKTGQPAEVIAKVAEADGHDLILMGSHGHTSLGNLVMGSVATRVLAHCKTPVLLVR
jgi:nucleotide-binding universal stress UspA family protein